MNKIWAKYASLMFISKDFLNRTGMIAVLLAVCTILYTAPCSAGSGGTPTKRVVVVGGSKPISGPGPGTWGYPGVAGPGGYPGVAGYGGYYPSWRHTQSKNYSGIPGNNGYPGISGSKGYPGVSGSKGYSGVAGNKSYSGISGSESYPGIPGSEGYPGISGD